MEFWATEVKSGETFKVETGEGMVLHLSQANLGEIKKNKSNESVCLFVNVDGKKLVLGTLSADKFPQQQFDLVFDQDFELSHNLKCGSVYFFGYKARNNDDDDLEGADFDSSSSEEDIPLAVENNGKPEAKKPAQEKASVDKKVNTEKKPDIVNNEDDDDDSDDSMSDDDDDSDEEDDDSDSEDEDDSSEEETPAKAEPSVNKKRPSSSDAEPVTPAANKKVKVTTPQKSDGKNGGGAAAHVATPHPSKKGEKTPAADQKQKIPTFGDGPHMCKSCSKKFGSEGGLDSHTKAKHSVAK